MQAGPLSVSDLNEYVRRSLASDPMLSGISIRGEISNFKRHISGHLYFSLKDEQSRIACVMFRQHAQTLRFQPQDGMSITLTGSVGLYTAAGSYQFYGESMQKQGAGALYEQYLRTKDALQKEGLFDPARKRPLPWMPKGVGIVTAAGGAVLHDILTVARRRFPGMPLYFRASQVQGEGAMEDLIRGLHEIASLPQVEVVIIGRGGGSLEDLWAFNLDPLVRAIAACEKPVISAVGHETDVTLADFAADVRAATPSAAAELAVPNKGEMLQKITHLTQSLHQQAQSALNDKSVAYEQALAKLQLHNPGHLVALAITREKSMLERLHLAAQSRLAGLQSLTAAIMDRFSLSGPQETLKRGYVIALSGNKPVLRAREVTKEMELLFQDGRVKVTTQDITLEKEGQDG